MAGDVINAPGPKPEPKLKLEPKPKLQAEVEVKAPVALFTWRAVEEAEHKAVGQRRSKRGRSSEILPATEQAPASHVDFGPSGPPASPTEAIDTECALAGPLILRATAYSA